MEILTGGLYFVSDAFFQKVQDPYLKINYEDTKRPHYFAFNDNKTGRDHFAESSALNLIHSALDRISPGFRQKSEYKRQPGYAHPKLPLWKILLWKNIFMKTVPLENISAEIAFINPGHSHRLSRIPQSG